MRWSALAVLVVLAVAGCSGKPPADDGDVAAPLLDSAGQPIVNGTAGNATPVPVTDRLHLASATRLNATGLDNLTILATLAGAQAQTLAWNMTLNGTGNVSYARLVLWVDLQASAVQSGVGGDPGCSASLLLAVTRNGTIAYQAGGCASLGQLTIAPGEYLLDLGTPLTAFPAGLVLAPGDKVLVQVTFGFSFPQGLGYVLSGGERDSLLHLPGLAEPVAPSGVGVF